MKRILNILVTLSLLLQGVTSCVCTGRYTNRLNSY